MDASVLQAMAKWPSVPAAYGWLALDRRGNWSLKGDPITNPAVTAFIGRNYACDQAGRWFFQNGPQRVFVRLAYVPFVLHVQPDADAAVLVAHTGERMGPCRAAFLDENGCLLLAFDDTVGLLSDRDLAGMLPRLRNADGSAATDDELEAWTAGAMPAGAALDLGRSRVSLRAIRSGEVAARFGFDPDPRPAPGEPEC